MLSSLTACFEDYLQKQTKKITKLSNDKTPTRSSITKNYCIHEIFHNPIPNVVGNIMKPVKPRSTRTVINTTVRKKGEVFQ